MLVRAHRLRCGYRQEYGSRIPLSDTQPRARSFVVAAFWGLVDAVERGQIFSIALLPAVLRDWRGFS